MKKARMNISHSRFILSKLKIFGEIASSLPNKKAIGNQVSAYMHFVAKKNLHLFTEISLLFFFCFFVGEKVWMEGYQ